MKLNYIINYISNYYNIEKQLAYIKNYIYNNIIVYKNII